MAETTHKIYDLIENERKERRQDINELHSRIDQILDAINKLSKGTDASWVRQSVGLTIAVISIVGIISGIIVGAINPIWQSIGYVKDSVQEYKVFNEDQRQQIMKVYDSKLTAEKDRYQARLNKLERISIRYTEQDLPEIREVIGRSDEQIQNLEEKVNDIKELFKIRDENIGILMKKE